MDAPSHSPGSAPDFAALAERAFDRTVADFAATIPRIRASADPNPVHDVRVAARRLSAKLRTFAPLLPEADQDLSKDLARLMRPAGRVRDLDVQVEWLASWRERFDLKEDPSVEIITGMIERRREPARIALEKELIRPRTGRLLDRLSDLSSRVRERDPGLAGRSAVIVAPKIIRKEHKRLVKSGESAKSLQGGTAAAQALHKLRIVCKRFRYTLESFEVLYPSAVPMLRRAAELQDLLGAFHDDEVAARDLQSFATHPSTALSASSAFLLGRVAELHRVEQRDLLEAFPKAYRNVTGSPWRRLRDEMRHQRRRVREEVERGSISGEARDRLGA